MASIQDHFTKGQREDIVDAIKEAELNTSGEIRVHMETTCKGDVLDRAATVFSMLKMHKTALRNGVLIYVAVESKMFAIIGDAGINSVVPMGFWDDVKETMLKFFKEGDIVKGLVNGIYMSGNKLKEFFPYQSNDINELPDDISFGR